MENVAHAQDKAAAQQVDQADNTWAHELMQQMGNPAGGVAGQMGNLTKGSEAAGAALPKVDFCDNQNLGSAAAVSCVLRQAGESVGKAVSTEDLRTKLQSMGWSKVGLDN